jgi:ABC-type branched-subunit amino acid transport system ATPase component
MNDLKEKHILDMQNVSKRFGGLVAIDQVSLQIHS